ncbi:MxaD family protein [Prauserella sp. PE36]|uniref:SRPBCC family protein n=1 Tax=Prauserella endophytica TaxID=1592324 RepID=A0ABY2S2W2_9PSEU|nr:MULTISPECIES: SRPBCC family protein [Prauserella]RBM23201.1 MxaD family protein [Prauserella sp. PE36]TKG69912.1 SRPBCC family protein [Prauserella endophytica]
MVGKTFTFEVRRTSTAAPETLFALETDGERWSSWARPLVLQSSWARHGEHAPGGVGAVRRVGLWPVLLGEQTVVYEPHRRHVYTFADGSAPVRDYRAEVLFTPNDAGGTDLTWRGSFTERVPGTGLPLRTVLHAAVRFLATRLIAAAERE